jgi:hypothetical protein
VHETIGHLGIFVSSGVAKKEHGEFSSNIDLIDTLPPGLYEATFEDKSEGTPSADLASGNWVMRCEQRTLEDIAAMGGNDAEDDRRFATAARLSEVNLALYRTFVQPTVRALSNSTSAEWLQRMHPLRLSYEMFSDANPWMRMVAGWAEKVRADRKPASDKNPFIAMQEQASNQTVKALDAWRDFSEKTAERTFHRMFGQPALQSALGIDAAAPHSVCKATMSPQHQELLEKRIAELKARISLGGPREAVIRGLVYAGMARGAVDERGFEMARRLREAHGEMSLSDFKAVVREQFNMLLIDEDAALAAIPAMLPDDIEKKREALDLIRQVLSARGALTDDDKTRFEEIARLFGVGDRTVTPVRPRGRGGPLAKAS